MKDTRNFLTRTGDLLLPRPILNILEYYHIGDKTTIFYITNWSIVHFLSGVLTAFLIVRYYPQRNLYWTGFYIHTIWELYQIAVRNTPITTLRGFTDTIVDTLLFMFGMFLYNYFIIPSK